MKIQSKFALFFITAALICSSATPAFSWDDTGHKVSTFIAWGQMTPAARARSISLLRRAPEDSHLAVYYASGSRSNSAKELELFTIASTWPDIVRNRDFPVRYEKYNKAPWHYADILWRQQNGQAQLEEMHSDGQAIQKLYDLEKILRDASVSDGEKAVALAWFLHVAGDIHNPLHNGSRISEAEPDGDRGGNRFLLTPEQQNQNRVNLHSYWDSILRRNIPRKGDACDSDYIPVIARLASRRYPFAKLNSRLKLGDYREWNSAGYKLLNEVVYTSDLVRNQLPAKKYQKRAFAVGQEQIALAGYRIAETLNHIFNELPTEKNTEN
jgi:hypothetical protein